MKAGVLFLAIIVMANIVAAGVISVLGSLVKDAGWAQGETWPWAIITLLGVACSIAFLKGSFEMLGSASRFKGKRSWPR